jgi:hypothetical protein
MCELNEPCDASALYRLARLSSPLAGDYRLKSSVAEEANGGGVIPSERAFLRVSLMIGIIATL